MPTRTITLDEDAYLAAERAASSANRSVSDFLAQLVHMNAEFESARARVAQSFAHLTEEQIDELVEAARPPHPGTAANQP
jgi:predicted CopG family antitoxin